MKESVTSVTNSGNGNSNDIADDLDLDNVSDDADDEQEEECSSLASDLSWFHDHYYTTEDPRTRYYIIRAQSFTSLKADLRQDISGGFAFSRCHFS